MGNQLKGKRIFGSTVSGSSSGGGVTPVYNDLDPVISQTNTPPAHVSGERYLVGIAPTGAWVGHANAIAESNGAAWTYTVPALNDYVYITSTLVTMRFDGTNWVPAPERAILQNGNSFGASGVRIGTNDAFPLWLKSNGLLRTMLSSTGELRHGSNILIGTTSSGASTKSILELRSTTKGFLLPRMTTVQKNAIVSPDAGLEVYDTDLNEVNYYNGSSWVGTGGSGSGTLNYIPKWTPDGTTLGNSRLYDASSGAVTLFNILDSGGSTYAHLKIDSATNLFFGYQSGDANLPGSGAIDNTAWGYGAMSANTTGTLNSAFGKRTMLSNTTGNGNNAFGAGALLSNNTGSHCNAFGYHALMSNKASDNCAFGNFVLLTCDTGASNNGFGKSALQGLSTGNANNAFGLECMIQNNGSANCGFGQQVFYSNTTGSNNTGFGSLAGYSTTGSGGVFLGNRAGYYETAGNKLFIDNDTRASEADGRLKALIYGVFDAAVANQRLTINGNVGIRGAATSTSPLNISSLPTSSAGLATGDVWNNLGILTIV